jgi:hypothetical protein
MKVVRGSTIPLSLKFYQGSGTTGPRLDYSSAVLTVRRKSFADAVQLVRTDPVNGVAFATISSDVTSQLSRGNHFVEFSLDFPGEETRVFPSVTFEIS